jgi:hypothetical protein
MIGHAFVVVKKDVKLNVGGMDESVETSWV